MNIGSFLGGIGRKIGSGVQQGVRRLGELRPDGLDDGAPMPQPRRPITGGFAGNEGVPTFDLGRMGRMQGEAGGSVEAQPMGGNSPQPMPQRPPMPAVNIAPPVEMRPNHPPLTGFDQGAGRMLDQEVAPIRDSATIRPDAEPRPVPMRGGMPSAIPMPQLPQEANPNDDRRNVPIPGLPNRGGPVPHSDYEAAKYDDWAKNAKRDADGNFDPKGGTRRSFKSVLQNALIGAASQSQNGIGGMLGGALGGGLGATINPQAGREVAFDAGQGAQMTQDQARRDTEMERQRKQQMGQLGIENVQSQIEGRRAQAETARMNAERQQRVADSTVKLNQARTEAAMRGNPVKVDLYNPEKDQVETVNVYPDGRREVLGISGNAMIRGATLEAQNQRDAANRESRERIAQMPARPRAGGASRTGGGDGIPTEARQEYGRVQRLKQQADALWTRAKTEADPEKKAALEEQARAALEDYNANTQDFGQAYGDYYETGQGKDGWAYIKPKAGGSVSGGGQSAPRATVAPDFVDRVMKQLGVDRATAIQRIQNSGIQVQ